MKGKCFTIDADNIGDSDYDDDDDDIDQKIIKRMIQTSKGRLAIRINKLEETATYMTGL